MAATFKDRNGREWTVALNVVAAKRVRELCGVNLADAPRTDLLVRLANDAILLADVLFALVKPQADAANITFDQFGESLDGEHMKAGLDAMLEGFPDFFSQPEQRRLMRSIVEKQKQLEPRVMELLEQKLNSPEVDAAIEKQLADFSASPITSGPNV